MSLNAFQQHSAPAHRTCEIVKLLLKEAELLRWIFDRQTASHPVDYQMWTTIRERVCRTHIHSVNELKKSETVVDSGLVQFVDKMVRKTSSMCSCEG